MSPPIFLPLGLVRKVNKFELMALMMNGGKTPAEVEEPTVEQNPADADYFLPSDLAVELGIAKPGPAAVLSTATNRPLIRGTVSRIDGFRFIEKKNIRQVVQDLKQERSTCKLCGAPNLIWLLTEEGRWRLYNADNTQHICIRPIPFGPLPAADDQ